MTAEGQGELLLELTEPFDLRRMARSHGWVKLDPFRWEEESGQLSYPLLLPSGRICTWRVEQPSPENLRLSVEDLPAIPDDDRLAVEEAVRWSLRLDESLSGFHVLCQQHPGLRTARSERLGRLLRSPTVWEDVAKTILTTCTTWDRTRAMVTALCREWGAPTPDGTRRTFPPPAALAAASEQELRRAAGLGYRARYLHALARLAAAEPARLEALKHDPRPTAELRAVLLALPGIGPYGAANLLMLLGRYDHIAVDSWVRRVVGKGWFGGQAVTDREIHAAFEPFGPWKALVYWFWDWETAAEEWSWRDDR